MNHVKYIAFYLPQFHTTPYNDRWWGKGFTEWINMKKATPFFKGHYQPRKPYNNNYYCLLENKTQEWQAELAKKYGIDGFCYYHYWFNGKLLLEKPMEKMLHNPEIDLSFCISWANEPWTRTWTGKEKEVLMPQEYGGMSDWKRHIEYLLPFFKDSRYIRIDGKPLFLLYRSGNIQNCDKMLDFWNAYLKNNGIDGLHVVETLTGHQKKPVLKNAAASVEMEPMYTIRHDLPVYIQAKRYIVKKLHLFRVSIYDVIDSDKIRRNILKRHHKTGNVTYPGAFVDWDNSPRWGKKAMILKGCTPEKFTDFLKKLTQKCEKEQIPFIFINAWNEWAEGTYLEPDERFGYQYLEAIQKVKEKYYENKI